MSGSILCFHLLALFTDGGQSSDFGSRPLSLTVRCAALSMRHALLLVVLLVGIGACDEGKVENHYSLKEVIDVEGTCSEDHVGQRDSYAGQVVRWQTVETGKILTYGFVTKKGDVTEHIADEVRHPTVYHTPEQIELSEIDVDTSQPTWVVHGISDRGSSEEEPTTGYNSTCNLEVVKRGMEIRPPDLGIEGREGVGSSRPR